MINKIDYREITNAALLFTNGCLIADDSQILDKMWLKKLNITICNTGNSMNKKEVSDFSNKVKMLEL